MTLCSFIQRVFIFSLLDCCNAVLHRVSRKLCQRICCSVLVKYEPISVKISRHVLEETLNKTMQKVPTSPKICASTTWGNLKWPIEPSTQYLHVHFNESLNTYKHDWQSLSQKSSNE